MESTEFGGGSPTNSSFHTQDNLSALFCCITASYYEHHHHCNRLATSNGSYAFLSCRDNQNHNRLTQMRAMMMVGSKYVCVCVCVCGNAGCRLFIIGCMCWCLCVFAAFISASGLHKNKNKVKRVSSQNICIRCRRKRVHFTSRRTRRTEDLLPLTKWTHGQSN